MSEHPRSLEAIHRGMHNCGLAAGLLRTTSAYSVCAPTAVLADEGCDRKSHSSAGPFRGAGWTAGCPWLGLGRPMLCWAGGLLPAETHQQMESSSEVNTCEIPVTLGWRCHYLTPVVISCPPLPLLEEPRGENSVQGPLQEPGAARSAAMWALEYLSHRDYAPLFPNAQIKQKNLQMAPLNAV